jgi:hypothetical protein
MVIVGFSALRLLGNDEILRGKGGNEAPLECRLEAHFVDQQREVGAFFEQLLNVA